MSKRPLDLLIEDIWEAVEKIARFIKGMTQEAFENDHKTSDAVIRNLEVIGEAASRLPDDFREKHPEIGWARIVGLRHRIVHEYFGVDLKIIWQILQKDLPIFKKALLTIRNEMGL